MLKQLREINDPFSLQEETFTKFFRLPKTLYWDFIHDLEQHDEQPSSLPLFVIRVCTSIIFYLLFVCFIILFFYNSLFQFFIFLPMAPTKNA